MFRVTVRPGLETSDTIYVNFELELEEFKDLIAWEQAFYRDDFTSTYELVFDTAKKLLKERFLRDYQKLGKGD